MSILSSIGSFFKKIFTSCFQRSRPYNPVRVEKREDPPPPLSLTRNEFSFVGEKESELPESFVQKDMRLFFNAETKINIEHQAELTRLVEGENSSKTKRWELEAKFNFLKAQKDTLLEAKKNDYLELFNHEDRLDRAEKQVINKYRQYLNQQNIVMGSKRVYLANKKITELDFCYREKLIAIKRQYHKIEGSTLEKIERDINKISRKKDQITKYEESRKSELSLKFEQKREGLKKEIHHMIESLEKSGEGSRITSRVRAAGA